MANSDEVFAAPQEWAAPHWGCANNRRCAGPPARTRDYGDESSWSIREYGSTQDWTRKRPVTDQ
eukprot:8530022-Alexandrium_andersonii.AAC.1